MSDTFKALVLTQEDGKTVSSIEQLSDTDLPEGDVLLAVDGRPISGFEDYHLAAAGFARDVAVSFRVRRGGEILDLEDRAVVVPLAHSRSSRRPENGCWVSCIFDAAFMHMTLSP